MSIFDDIAQSVRNTAGKAVYYGQQAKLPEMKVSESLNWLANKIAPKAKAMEFTVPPEATKLPGQIFPVLNPTYGPTYNGPQATSPAQQQQTTSGNDNPNPGQEETVNNGLEALIQSARNAFNEGKSRYYDPMMKMIGEKRNQFQDSFSQGQGDISQGYSKEAGSAGRTAEAQRTATANSARALGTGGSFLQGSQNRVNDALARTLASAGQVRTQNEQANRELLGQRQDWATGQEATLDNYLGGLQGNVDNAMSGRTQSIANMNAPTIDSGYGTGKAATDFSGIADYLSQLLGGTSVTPNQGTTEMGVSVDPNSDYYNLLKKNKVVA